MEKIMEPFGKRLKELRKREHKTQVEMAKMLECTDRTTSGWSTAM